MDPTRITPGGITPGARAVALGRPSLPAVSARGQAAWGRACRNARSRDLALSVPGSEQPDPSKTTPLRAGRLPTLERIVRTRTG